MCSIWKRNTPYSRELNSPRYGRLQIDGTLFFKRSWRMLGRFLLIQPPRSMVSCGWSCPRGNFRELSKTFKAKFVGCSHCTTYDSYQFNQVDLFASASIFLAYFGTVKPRGYRIHIPYFQDSIYRQRSDASHCLNESVQPSLGSGTA